MLIYKKNELKRLIRSNSLPSKVENKHTQKIILNNGDISHLFGSKSLYNIDKNNQITNENSKYYEVENDSKKQVKEHELEDFKKYMEKHDNVENKSKSKKKLFSKTKNNNEINSESDN